MGPSPIICSSLIICYLEKMTSLINGKNTLSNSSPRRAPPTEPERYHTTDILTHELQPTITPLKPASIDQIRADLIKSVSRQGKWSVSHSLGGRNNYCGLANGNYCPHLQKVRPVEVLQLQIHYSVEPPSKSLCKTFGRETILNVAFGQNNWPTCSHLDKASGKSTRQWLHLIIGSLDKRPQRLSDHWQPFALSTMIVKTLILVGLQQGCVFSPLVFIILMERISQRSTTPYSMTIRVESLLFAGRHRQLL